MQHEVVILARDDPYLAARAGAIRALANGWRATSIEIGRLLTECKDHVGHGG